MTKEMVCLKISTASKVCYFAHGMFNAMMETQEMADNCILDEGFVSSIYDMSLRDIAKLLDTVKEGGGALINECPDILS